MNSSQNKNRGHTIRLSYDSTTYTLLYSTMIGTPSTRTVRVMLNFNRSLFVCLFVYDVFGSSGTALLYSTLQRKVFTLRLDR